MSSTARGRRSVVIVGGTSKWEPGPATGSEPTRSALGMSGLGAALGLAFGSRGHRVYLSSRQEQRAQDLARALQGVEVDAVGLGLDVASPESVDAAFETVMSGGLPLGSVVYNVGHAAGRDLGPEHDAFDTFPASLFEIAVHGSVVGPFHVAQRALGIMRRQQTGCFLMANNAASLRGRRRRRGESLYYLRGSMRTLCQALAEEYHPLGVHVANVVIGGMIRSAGTLAATDDGEPLLDASEIAEFFVMLSEQGPSVWTDELVLSHSRTPPCW